MNVCGLNRKGNTLLITLMLGAGIAVAITGALKLSSNARRSLAANQARERNKSLINKIAEKTITDLRAQFMANVGPEPENCSLDHLLTETSTQFKQSAPKVYPKGLFMVDVSSAHDQSIWVVPESDPEVYIEKGSGEYWYLIHIRTSICSKPVGGRLPFAEDQGNGLGLSWNTPCEHPEVVADRRFVNVASSQFAKASERRGCVGFPSDSDPNSPAPNPNSLYTEPLGKLMVVHSQTTTAPTCPNGFVPLWHGFSYMGAWMSAGRGSPQDLGRSGSCVENLMNVPFLACRVGDCNYKTSSDRSLWLSVERYQQVESKDMNRNGDERAEAEANISRCTVCEGTHDVLVQHSQTTTAPDCPSGWDLAWTGYSFGSATADGAGYDSGQDLGGTGSCLKVFVPAPTNYCEYTKCVGGVGYNGWLIAKSAESDKSSHAIANITDLAAQKNRISRCSVCTKGDQ